MIEIERNNSDKKNRIKVLMLVSNLRVSNGVTSFVMSYFRKIDHTSIHMDFALLSDWKSPYYEEIREQGGEVYILPTVTNIIAHCKECKRILETGNYDIICDNSLILTIPMMSMAKLFRVPVRILHSHNTKLSSNPRKALVEKALLPLLKQQCTDYCACGEMAGKALFGEKPFTVIPNVISVENNHFNLDKRESKRNEMKVTDQIVVATVGRTSLQKNPFFTIDVIIDLSKRIHNLVFWWIGSGELDDLLKEYTHSKNGDEFIMFLGSRNDVVDLYQAMDIFVLPSLFEGLPITGIEAQAFGLPCVLSNTITHEVKYTDLVDFLPIDEGTDVWVNALLSSMNYVRKSQHEALLNSPFADTNAGFNMEKCYRELLKKRS